MKSFHLLKMKLKLILLVSISIFQFLSCSTNQSTNPENKSITSKVNNQNQDFSNRPVNLNNEKERQKFEEISSKINQNRNLWKEKNVSNYDFKIQRYAEGVGGDFNLKFEVRGNKTLPVKRENNYPHPNYYEEINSVEKLFNHIQQTLERGYDIDVEFDKEYGFPKSIKSISKISTGYEFLEIKRLEIVK